MRGVPSEIPKGGRALPHADVSSETWAMSVRDEDQTSREISSGISSELSREISREISCKMSREISREIPCKMSLESSHEMVRCVYVRDHPRDILRNLPRDVLREHPGDHPRSFAGSSEVICGISSVSRPSVELAG